MNQQCSPHGSRFYRPPASAICILTLNNIVHIIALFCHTLSPSFFDNGPGRTRTFGVSSVGDLQSPAVAAVPPAQTCIKRRCRDSNPGFGFTEILFSRQAPSATRPHLQKAEALGFEPRHQLIDLPVFETGPFILWGTLPFLMGIYYHAALCKFAQVEYFFINVAKKRLYRESNPYHQLRTLLFYPLNYAGKS